MCVSFLNGEEIYHPKITHIQTFPPDKHTQMPLIGLARVAYRLLLCKVSSQMRQSLLPSHPVVAVVQFGNWLT
jgi:hypothetical protein